MTIALVQSDLFWEEPEKNRAMFADVIQSISEEAAIVILPEMFSTGFTMTPKDVAESMDGETVSWMKRISAAKQTAICGSVIISENGKYHNRLLFVKPTGEINHYDKRHLFSLAGEDKVYFPGKEKLIVEYQGWRICLMICYDLRFPVFSRNAGDYDLLLYVANWPEARATAWNALLKARAIENMSYVVGVNRIGKDGNGHNYAGHSQVVDYLGNYLVAPVEGRRVLICNLEKNGLFEARKKFGFLNDRDEFTVH